MRREGGGRARRIARTAHRVNWFVRQRQSWIGEMLEIYGFIRRDHLRRKFGISIPQASADLRQYFREHPDRMRYDLTRKAYVRNGRTTAVRRDGAV